MKLQLVTTALEACKESERSLSRVDTQDSERSIDSNCCFSHVVE